MASHGPDALKVLLESAIENSTQLWQQELKSLVPDASIRLAGKLRETGLNVGDEEILSSEVVENYVNSVSGKFRGRGSTFEASSSSYRVQFPLLDGGSYIIDDRHLHSIIKSQKYPDVQIIVSNEPDTPAIFFSYRSILSSRSLHFRLALDQNIGGNMTSREEWFGGNMIYREEWSITLPGTSFTPESFSFILGYLHSGTLKFTQRQYYLMTAFYIYRGSVYLELPVLRQLILAQITVEMLHGFYYAPLSNDVFSQLVGGDWSTMVKLGCQCRTCACYAPRVLQFALEYDIQDGILERGARRAIVALFGSGWCTEEFSALPKRLFYSILTDVQEIITPSNAFRLLFEAEEALLYLNNNFSGHLANRVLSRIIAVRESIDEVICADLQACFEFQTWRDIMKDNRSDDSNLRAEKSGQVAWVMWAISRGITQQNMTTIYQALIFGINLNTQRGLSALARSPIRARIEAMEAERLPKVLPVPRTREVLQRDTDSLYSSLERRSSAPSLYSFVSTQSRVPSLEEPTNAAYSVYLAAFDLSSPSEVVENANEQHESFCSLASSRTISTEYGLYYTRWAISQETIEDESYGPVLRRRRSWDSF